MLFALLLLLVSARLHCRRCHCRCYHRWAGVTDDAAKAGVTGSLEISSSGTRHLIDNKNFVEGRRTFRCDQRAVNIPQPSACSQHTSAISVQSTCPQPSARHQHAISHQHRPCRKRRAKRQSDSTETGSAARGRSCTHRDKHSTLMIALIDVLTGRVLQRLN